MFSVHYSAVYTCLQIWPRIVSIVTVILQIREKSRKMEEKDFFSIISHSMNLIKRFKYSKIKGSSLVVYHHNELLWFSASICRQQRNLKEKAKKKVIFNLLRTSLKASENAATTQKKSK